jgi:hypothetical protein
LFVLEVIMMSRIMITSSLLPLSLFGQPAAVAAEIHCVFAAASEKDTDRSWIVFNTIFASPMNHIAALRLKTTAFDSQRTSLRTYW